MPMLPSATLNAALQRICNNKFELLLVLDRPDILLHNNGAETLFGSMSKSVKLVTVLEVSLSENVEIHLQA